MKLDRRCYVKYYLTQHLETTTTLLLLLLLATTIKLWIKPPVILFLLLITTIQPSSLSTEALQSIRLSEMRKNHFYNYCYHNKQKDHHKRKKYHDHLQ